MDGEQLAKGNSNLDLLFIIYIVPDTRELKAEEYLEENAAWKQSGTQLFEGRRETKASDSQIINSISQNNLSLFFFFTNFYYFQTMERLLKRVYDSGCPMWQRNARVFTRRRVDEKRKIFRKDVEVAAKMKKQEMETFQHKLKCHCIIKYQKSSQFPFTIAFALEKLSEHPVQ